MGRLVGVLSLTSLLLIASGCEQPANRSDSASETVAASTPDPTLASPAGEGGEAAEHGAGGHAAAGEGEALLPIMQRLGSEMTTLTYALMTDDYQTVERSAAAIAEHAPISAEELERIHGILGSDMARFEAGDESVHVASVRLHEAAQARQPGAVVGRLGEVQRGCVSCHVQFRDRLLSNRAER